MTKPSIEIGVVLALTCLAILGAMPVISNSRPDGFSALSFALFLSVWQVIAATPLFVKDSTGAERGVFSPGLCRARRRRAVGIVLATGVIFGLSTFVYVLAVEKAGAVGAAIAIQAYPLFAILWETLFLRRRKTPLELGFTALLLIALSHIATGGTWRIEGFSAWFAFALLVPFLWSVAHVILKELLVATPVTPGQVTFFRVFVSVGLLLPALMLVEGGEAIARDLTTPSFQAVAALMGVAYYAELVLWFYAMRHIDVSMASSITAPAPALTMVFATVYLGDQVTADHIVALSLIILSVYGLIYAGARKQRRIA